MEWKGLEQGDGIKPPSSAGVGGGSVWEIEEEVVPQETSEAPQQHGRGRGEEGEDVYVAVGKGRSSMDALLWALRHAAKPSSFVYLVHVFPEVHHIPTPLGMLPRNQVTPQQVETHISQERRKRRELLHKYTSLCHNSKVDVDDYLIESDSVAKAILELIPVLHITRLIMGISKSNLR